MTTITTSPIENVPEVTALGVVADKVRNRYMNTSNYHAPVKESLEVGASGLAKYTCRELWKKANMGDDAPKRMAFIGNALGDAALQDIEHNETRFIWPTGYGKWMVSGTADGLDVVNIEGAVYVVAAEGKSHETMSKDKVEVARRQGMLCLGLAWRNHKAGNSGPWMPAEWAPDNKPFTWPDGAKPAGVVVCLHPTKPEDGQLHTYTVTAEQCDQVVDFYVAKAIAFAKSIESGNPDEAESWDKSAMGVQEFPFLFEEIGNHDIPELAALIARRDELDDSKAHIEDEMKRINADIETTLRTNNMVKTKVDGRTVQLVEMPETNVAFTRRPYTQIRVGKPQGE